MKNPLKGKSRTVQILVVIGIILLIAGASAMIYKLQQSNNATGTVTEGITYIPVSLSVTPSTITEGQNYVLVATVTNANAIGKQVTFMEGTATLGTAQIQDVAGVYKAEYTVVNPSAGTHTYHTAAEP